MACQLAAKLSSDLLKIDGKAKSSFVKRAPAVLGEVDLFEETFGTGDEGPTPPPKPSARDRAAAKWGNLPN